MFLLATLYASAGFGGASGYLTDMSRFAQWGNSKQAAASSGGFIAINSVSGLVGRFAGGTLVFGQFGLLLLPVGISGALLGSQLGAGRLSGAGVRRLLGVVLTIAACTYWIKFLAG